MLQNEPLQRQALEQLVVICLQSGRPDEALTGLEQLVEACPEEPIYCKRLASLLERRGRTDDAIGCYQRLLAARPGLTNTRFNLARLLKRAGLDEQALREYELCLAADIEHPEEVHNNIGVIHGARHRHELALTSLQTALALNPGYIPALYNLALLREERGDWPQARALFDRILQREPEHPGALTHIAHAEKTNDPVAPVIRQMKRALRRDNLAGIDREELLYALGKTHDDCGHYDRAFDYYREANQLSQRRSGRYDRAAQARLVDDIIGHCDRDWLQSIAPVSDLPLVFICGMFRSGSTLLEQMLAAHDALTAGGEIDFFQRELAPFPRAMISLEAVTLRQRGRQYLNYLTGTFGDRTRVINKRPDNFYCLGLLHALYPNSRFLNTLRAPLDNCLSLYFQPMEAAQSQANDLLDAGHYYLQYLRLMEHWRQLLGDALVDVRYEALVSSPREVLSEVLAFLQLDWQEQCLDFHRTDNRIRTASTHQVRQGLYQESSGRWAHYAGPLEQLRAELEQAGLADRVPK